MNRLVAVPCQAFSPSLANVEFRTETPQALFEVVAETSALGFFDAPHATTRYEFLFISDIAVRIVAARRSVPFAQEKGRIPPKTVPGCGSELPQQRACHDLSLTPQQGKLRRFSHGARLLHAIDI